ncbi:MAG TPA: hypothetical protein VFD71_07260 [Planctomycetota bacterium]|nr:hypothetical protein [Planctomycetota bacterium]
MERRTRRQFLAEVGKGMVAASVGVGAALELDLLPRAMAADGPDELTFGALEPLTAFLQETPIEKLVPAIIARLRSGTPLRDLVAAAALSNARTFGGEDYVGFHTLMAIAPAYRMALETPEARRPLPVIKVLYRNTRRIHEHGGRASEVLHPVKPRELPAGQPAAEALRDAVRRKSAEDAEGLFASIAHGSAEDAFNGVLCAVEDGTDVHRVVLPYRAWDLLDIVGKEHAHTLLRQSVRYCLRAEQGTYGERYQRSRTLLPELFARHHLLDRPVGTRRPDDAWVQATSLAILFAKPDDAAGLAAEALADGIAPDAVGEAISLATNQLVLRDHGRREREISDGKPLGSVHGDSIGVHACDSANAWRSMAKSANARNTLACVILGAYQAALDRVDRGGEFDTWQPYPHSEELEKVKAKTPEDLLREAEGAIRANDQALASAVVHRIGELGHPERPVLDMFLRFATSEDGALHAEKYFRTVSEEFAAARPAFRWRQLVALSRVTASEFGRPAPGYAEACEILKV